jgi:toxin FitB
MPSLVDTSLAVPLVLTSHLAHERVNAKVGDRTLHLAAHSALETYSVLTRLPGDARLAPVDASRLLSERFGAAIVPDEEVCQGLVAALAELHIAGGAVYDALIAVTARGVDGVLLTRDRRAAATYATLKVTVEMVG